MGYKWSKYAWWFVTLSLTYPLISSAIDPLGFNELPVKAQASFVAQGIIILVSFIYAFFASRSAVVSFILSFFFAIMVLVLAQLAPGGGHVLMRVSWIVLGVIYIWSGLELVGRIQNKKRSYFD